MNMGHGNRHLMWVRFILLGAYVAWIALGLCSTRTVVQAAPPSLARTKTADGREVVANRVIVGFQPGTPDSDKDATIRTVAQQRSGVLPSVVPLQSIGDARLIDVTGTTSLDDAIQAYRADPRVQYVEPDYVAHIAVTPNDPSFSQQYGMSIIQAPAAWNITHGSATVKIAILDCGIYEAHPDLAGKVVLEQNFTGSVYGTDDRCNHGTHVAGIASAKTNNGVGVAGVGYDTALMNGKILGDDGYGDIVNIASGITWAAMNGANVINMSLGGFGDCPQTLQNAIDGAWASNVVVVAAAGNDGANETFYPADCNHVVSVASTNASDARSSFSNYGAWVTVAAPGSAIYSTVNPTLSENSGSLYEVFSGTSMASPHVAGLAGLLWATQWGTSAQAVVDRLTSTGDVRTDATVGWIFRRINADAAVLGRPPQSTSITPASAATSGGTTATIAGSGFRTGATVKFGGAAATVTAVTDGAITAKIPTHVPGVVDVVVTNPDGQSATLAGGFTYILVLTPRPATPAPGVPSANPAPRASSGSAAPAAGSPLPAPIPVGR